MSTGRILIYGGKGALGSVCVSVFKAQRWWVGSIDTALNETADANIILNVQSNLTEQETYLHSELKSALGEEKLDAVICVAGGWAGGNASSKDFIKNSDLMVKQSVNSSLLASSIASKFLKNGGLLTLTGAAAATESTPSMIGYGMAKSAVHHLTKSLAAPKSGLPENATALAILPVTLDTPMNRKWMPKADTSTWTPLNFVAELFLKWANGEERPASGSLIKLITEQNVTKLVNV